MFGVKLTAELTLFSDPDTKLPLSRNLLDLLRDMNALRTITLKCIQLDFRNK